MKRIFFVSFCLLIALSFMATTVFAMGGAPPEQKTEVEEVIVETKAPVSMGDEYLIDNFESGSLKSPRDWWTFDIQQGRIDSNSSKTSGDGRVQASVGKYSFLLAGPAKNWYAGGCGTYLAKENMDLSLYNGFQIDVYGNGEGSGTLKIELIDDDNENWQVEQDPNKNYAPIYDDKFVYDMQVSWDGWQRVDIPFDDFVDDNPDVGDDIWNPGQNGESGGLLQLQMVCLGSDEKAKINMNLDNIKLIIDESY